jgi:hypothetical protein
MRGVTLDQAQMVKRVILQQFGHLGQIVGVGITRRDGDYAVKVNLSEPLQSGAELPSALSGVPLVVEVVGTIKRR